MVVCGLGGKKDGDAARRIYPSIHPSIHPFIHSSIHPNDTPNRPTNAHDDAHRPPVLAALAARVPSPYVEEAELHFDALLGRLHVRDCGVGWMGWWVGLCFGVVGYSSIDPPRPNIPPLSQRSPLLTTPTRKSKHKHMIYI